MRKSLGLNSAVTAAFLILCSASGSNAEPDASIAHAAAPVEAAQGPNMTVVPDRDTHMCRPLKQQTTPQELRPRFQSRLPTQVVTFSIAPLQLMAFRPSSLRV